MVKRSFCFFLILGALFGCSPKPMADIPEIPKDHPANKFYNFVAQNVVSDRVCRDFQGDPSIPMGEIVKGEKYLKMKELAPGVFRFSDKGTGKKYLGVSFLQYQLFLQIPKLCAWEETSNRVQGTGHRDLERNI